MTLKRTWTQVAEMSREKTLQEGGYIRKETEQLVQDESPSHVVAAKTNVILSHIQRVLRSGCDVDSRFSVLSSLSTSVYRSL